MIPQVTKILAGKGIGSLRKGLACPTRQQRQVFRIESKPLTVISIVSVSDLKGMSDNA